MIPGHMDSVCSIELIKSHTIVSVSLDKFLKIWDYTTGTLLSSRFLQTEGLYVANLDSSRFVVATKGELNVYSSIDYTKQTSLTYNGYNLNLF